MSKALLLLQEMEPGEVFILRVPGATTAADFTLRGADGIACYQTSTLTTEQVEEIREWLLTDTVLTGKVKN